jgi:hypothetical protein
VPGLVLPNFFGVITANMGRKFLLPLQLEVAQHFSEGCAGVSSGFSDPAKPESPTGRHYLPVCPGFDSSIPLQDWSCSSQTQNSLSQICLSSVFGLVVKVLTRETQTMEGAD